jgi:hypothetical protein
VQGRGGDGEAGREALRCLVELGARYSGAGTLAPISVRILVVSGLEGEWSVDEIEIEVIEPEPVQARPFPPPGESRTRGVSAHRRQRPACRPARAK